MTLILIGALVAVAGGVLGAIGTYLHNKKSSERNERIETNTQAIRNENESLKLQQSELLTKQAATERKLDLSLSEQKTLREQLQPFIELATKKFPKEETGDALKHLHQEITISISGGNNTFNFGPVDRVLNDVLKRQIIEAVDKDRPVDVTSTQGDAEALRFARTIQAFLKSTGFTVSAAVSSIMQTPPLPPLSYDKARNRIAVGSR